MNYYYKHEAGYHWYGNRWNKYSKQEKRHRFWHTSGYSRGRTFYYDNRGSYKGQSIEVK